MITVRHLVEQRQFALQLVAGSRGLDHEVGWIHTSDLTAPWHYLSRSETLLTNGTGMTADPQAQVTFVQRLARAGASALGYGLGTGPALTQAAIDRADSIGLPLFTVPRPVRFSEIMHWAASAILGEPPDESAESGRIYSLLTAAVARFDTVLAEADWVAVTGLAGRAGGLSDQASWSVPSTLADATELVRRTIGPLVEHDAAHGSQYVRTLRVWLDCDRSWQVAADALSIHKQTLGYRLRRIESLIGHGTSATEDIVHLWLGLQALDLVARTEQRGRARVAAGRQGAQRRGSARPSERERPDPSWGARPSGVEV